MTTTTKLVLLEILGQLSVFITVFGPLISMGLILNYQPKSFGLPLFTGALVFFAGMSLNNLVIDLIIYYEYEERNSEKKSQSKSS